MEEWKEYRLGDLIELNNGFAFKSKDFIQSGIPVIKIKNVKPNRILLDDLSFVSDEIAQHKSCVRILPSDILITMTGNRKDGGSDSWVGKVALFKKEGEYLLNQRVGAIKVKRHDLINYKYLAYLLSSWESQLYFINHSNSSGGQANISPEVVNNYTIYIPSLHTQSCISNILSFLDDKIELNRRVNENLEQQAQALFKSWFVDFEPFKDGKFVDSELGMIPEGWKVIELQSMVTIKRGGSPRPIQEYLSETGLRWLKISDATCNSSPFILEIKEHIKESGLNKTVLLNKGELVLSNSATPGIPKFLGVDSCIHDGWLYFPVSSLSKEFLYLLFKEKRNELLSQGNGSVFLNLKTEIVKSLKIAICSKNTLDKFDNIIMPLFNKINELSLEIDRLTKLRDTLLPKLMTGEIKIN